MPPNPALFWHLIFKNFLLGACSQTPYNKHAEGSLHTCLWYTCIWIHISNFCIWASKIYIVSSWSELNSKYIPIVSYWWKPHFKNPGYAPGLDWHYNFYCFCTWSHNYNIILWKQCTIVLWAFFLSSVIIIILCLVGGAITLVTGVGAFRYRLLARLTFIPVCYALKNAITQCSKCQKLLSCWRSEWRRSISKS